METHPSGLIAHLTVGDGAKAIEFYKNAFGAVEVMRMPDQSGKKLMHASIMIGDATMYLCDDFPEYCGGTSRTPTALGGTPITIHQNVADTDAAIAKAAKAGAKVTMPAADMFWGDRYGKVQDPFGHEWSFGTPIKK